MSAHTCLEEIYYIASSTTNSLSGAVIFKTKFINKQKWSDNQRVITTDERARLPHMHISTIGFGSRDDSPHVVEPLIMTGF